MGEKDGVIDVAPDWVLHRKMFSASQNFVILRWIFNLISYFSLALGLPH